MTLESDTGRRPCVSDGANDQGSIGAITSSCRRTRSHKFISFSSGICLPRPKEQIQRRGRCQDVRHSWNETHWVCVLSSAVSGALDVCEEEGHRPRLRNQQFRITGRRSGSGNYQISNKYHLFSEWRKTKDDDLPSVQWTTWIIEHIDKDLVDSDDIQPSLPLFPDQNEVLRRWNLFLKSEFCYGPTVDSLRLCWKKKRTCKMSRSEWKSGRIQNIWCTSGLVISNSFRLIHPLNNISRFKTSHQYELNLS